MGLMAGHAACCTHELITECIFLASCIRLQKPSCPHGLWASLRHPVLQGNGLFAVDTEIVSQRHVSQQQHLSRDCSGVLSASRHTDYEEVVSASHSWHACTKSVSFE